MQSAILPLMERSPFHCWKKNQMPCCQSATRVSASRQSIYRIFSSVSTAWTKPAPGLMAGLDWGWQLPKLLPNRTKAKFRWRVKLGKAPHLLSQYQWKYSRNNVLGHLLTNG